MRRTPGGLFSPPVFPNDENKKRIAGYVHWIALVFMAVIVAYIIFAKITAGVFNLNLFDGILFGVAILIYGISVHSKRGYVRQAGLLLVTILWLAINGTAFYGAGIRDSSFLANFAVLLAAGLLIGWKAAVTLSGLTIAVGIGLAYAEEYGISPA